MKVITFYGATGIGYGFQQADTKADWFKQPGLAVFAAPDAYGWRVIRVVELSGRDHDVRPLWALHDAERYGADIVFVSNYTDAAERRIILGDIEAGLSPVLTGTGRNRLALAA